MEPTSTAQNNGSVEGSGVDDEDVIVSAEETVASCGGKPDAGNRALRARFGRCHTHNEELCVASCGVILGRATFYGSEAPNGVRVSNPHAIQEILIKVCLTRHSGWGFFQPKPHSHVFSGMTITAKL